MGYALENLRVLIVDPSSHIRDLLRTILQTVGTGTIDLANDAELGFARYCRNEYDVVFTDSEMAPISGFDFVELIRSSPKSPNPYVPIVMLSAYSDQARVKFARDHGVTEFLAKPFTADVILTRLEEVIENPRSFVRTVKYFGPDRRRNPDPDYSGMERRKTTLKQVSLTKRDISKQQAELAKSKAAIDELAND